MSSHDPLLPEPAGTDRRDFLQQLMTASAAVAGAGLLGACAPAQAVPGAPTPAPAAGGAASTPAARAAVVAQQAAAAPAQVTWDMSWQQKLGKYRTAYDAPEVQDGAALWFANAAMNGYKAAMQVPDGEFTPVLVLRHAAAIMVLNDAMWARLDAGTELKLKDPTTGEPAKRNPFIKWAQGDKHSLVSRTVALDALQERGAIVLTCNNALLGISARLRGKEPSLTREQAVAAVREAVLPGVYVMPNGIFACSAAQDAGCHYMRVLV